MLRFCCFGCGWLGCWSNIERAASCRDPCFASAVPVPATTVALGESALLLLLPLLLLVMAELNSGKGIDSMETQPTRLKQNPTASAESRSNGTAPEKIAVNATIAKGKYFGGIAMKATVRFAPVEGRATSRDRIEGKRPMQKLPIK